MGTLHTGRNLVAILLWSIGYFLLLAPLAGFSFYLGADRRRRTWIPGTVALTIGLAIFGMGRLLEIPWPDMFMPLPLVLAVATAIALRIWWRDRADPGRRECLAFRVGLLVWALVLLGKIVLNAGVQHYGFVLAMPATLLWVLALTGWIPRWIDGRGGWGDIFRWATVAVLIVGVGAHLAIMKTHLDRKRWPVGSGSDRFLADDRGEAVDAALKELAGGGDGKPTLVAFPEGAMLNYLSRTVNPTRHTNFMPTEMVLFGEDQILSDLSAHPPDRIALVQKDTSEFGARFFGRDYARHLAAWIETHYRPVTLIGSVPFRNQSFGIAILTRERERKRSAP